jgi:hypothetical protein
VRIRSVACLGLALVVVGFSCAVACADGPFEPNETAAQAFGPLTGQTITAAFETPQDVDWYRFYAKPERQIGLLATMPSPCAIPGSIRVAVYDADGAVGLPVISLTLGYTGSTTPATAANDTMTSRRGHRYLVKVTESLCRDVAYTLQVAPAEDLSSTLGDTGACMTARSAASTENRRLADLRSAIKHAHGTRRTALRRRWQLQQQTVTTARASQQVACTRSALTGYPYE